MRERTRLSISPGNFAFERLFVARLSLKSTAVYSKTGTGKAEPFPYTGGER